MEIHRLHVLLIEDNPTDALLVEVAFEEMTLVEATVDHAECLGDGLALLSNKELPAFDVVLLDLNLPDSHDLSAFERIALAAPQVPVIVLTGLADEKRALQALHLGASDYLVKGQSEAAVLERSVRYAIERKRAEDWRFEMERARAAQAEAEEASRTKDMFLATLSHELRTPLNAILGWAHLMNSGALEPEETRDALEIIERNARAQARLIEELLDVSSSIVGKMVLYPEPIDFAHIVERGVQNVVPEAQQKNLTITTKTQPSSLEGDAARLQQVVANLLANAIKFTPAGGSIAVSLQVESQRAVLRISDSGEGIAPEFLPHVYERFRQADSSATRRHGGLGIGLAIVRTIAELHGGSARAQSAGVGQGATFSIEIPLEA